MMYTLIKPSEVVNGGILRPAPLNSRFDTQLIAPHIQLAEERFVIPVLQPDFYEQLIEIQNPNPSNYNPKLGAIEPKFPSDSNLETLWKRHLLHYIALCVTLQSLPHIAMQVGSNGITLSDSTNATNAGPKGLTFLQDTYQGNIKLKRKTLENYLKKNASFFPLYTLQKPDGSSGVEIDPKTGIVFY